MNKSSKQQSVKNAEAVIGIWELADFDAIEVHGVRVDGPHLVIDEAGPDAFCTYLRKTRASNPLFRDSLMSQPARCGDFKELWAAQEYAAELSERYGWPVIDHVLAAALDQEPVESTEHVSSPPGM